MIEGIISVGWYLILIGVLFLAIETFNPGFFLGVPGTTLIIIGSVSLIVPDIFSSPWLIAIAIVTALVSAGVSVWIYSLIGSGSTKPETTSKDSLIGKTGLVIKDVDSDGISGKVRIENADWSARCKSGTIATGKKVKVVFSEGVHVVVEEC